MAAVIAINNGAVTALLEALQERVGNMSPVLRAIGEDVMERSKQRFSTSTAPDGSPWAANTQATLIAYLGKRRGFSDKTSKINAKGQKLAIGKKPLIAQGTLADQLKTDPTDTSVIIGSTMGYAAMQQFGGTKSQFLHLWGDIPARPFLPITASGDLYPQEQELILDMLQNYLSLN